MLNVIFHIAHKRSWEKAQEQGFYHIESLEVEGFIHFSRAHQIIEVARIFFSGHADLLLLEVDVSKLKAPLKDDPVGECESFPHLYGPLNLDAVVKVSPFFVK